MSLLFMDGFDWLDAGQDQTHMMYKWTNTSATVNVFVDNAAPRNGGANYARFQSSAVYETAWMSKSVPTLLTNELYVGFAINLCSLVTDAYGGFMEVWTNTGSHYTNQIWFPYSSTYGKCGVKISHCLSNGTTLVGHDPLVYDIPIDTWVYVEVYTVAESNVGSCIVKVNGVIANQIYDVDMYSGDLAYIKFTNNISGARTPPAFLLDDIYICDASGATNNSFLGDVQVKNIRPNGAGLNTDFTPTGQPNNYECVDGSIEFTDYVTSEVTGHTDLYTYGDLPIENFEILGVASNLFANRDGPGFRNICHVLSDGSNESESPVFIPGESITYNRILMELNPITGQPFTKAEIDAMQFGFRLKS